MCKWLASPEDDDASTNISKPLIPNSPTLLKQKPRLLFSFSIINEAKCIAKISLPMILTSLLLYSRSIISTLFLARLGPLPLAAGSLAMAFANITAYSVLSGLAMGMEPICSQAFGAKKFKLLAIAMHRTILLLLLTSIIISFLWLNMCTILIFFGQDQEIANMAQIFIYYSLPDLLAQSFLHPIRIYLRSQSITLPLTCCSALSILLHVPINYLLLHVLHLGIKGVALASVWTNFNLVASLILYTVFSRYHRRAWTRVNLSKFFSGWKKLLSLSFPSCASVCLEWWWYEIMILLCGLLTDPHASVASMGVLIQTTALIYIFPSSLSFGVSTRVGNELGAENPKQAKLAAVVGLCFSFVLAFSALTFAFSVRNVWASMFTEDKNIIALTTMVLPIIGLCEIGNCPQTTVCGVLRGTARPKLGATLNLGCFYVVGMPVAVWLGFFGGFDFKGLWLGMLAAQGCCMVTMLFVLVRTNWEGQAQKAKDLMTSSEELGDDADDDDDDDDDDYDDHDEKWCLGMCCPKELA